MNSDIRVECTFKGHRKRLRLRGWLGDRATDYLIDLWVTVAEERPTGTLTGWDERDIALAAGYPDDPHKFVDALIDCKWLHKQDGLYCLHEWAEHQPWVVKGPERSEAARIAGLASAARRRTSNGSSTGRQRTDDAASTARQPLNGSSTPSPSPSPLPNKPPISPKGFEQFWAAYPKKKSKGQAEKAFSKINPDEQLLATMIATIERAKTSEDWIKDQGRYIPHPATWLNAKGWEDEISTPTGKGQEGKDWNARG